MMERMKNEKGLDNKAKRNRETETKRDRDEERNLREIKKMKEGRKAK